MSCSRTACAIFVARPDINEYVVKHYLNVPATHWKLFERSYLIGEGEGAAGNIPRAWLAPLMKSKLMLNKSHPYMYLSLTSFHHPV
jgi:hypothetical protein